MGRKRKTNHQLPEYVYVRRGMFVYRAHLGNGKFGKYVKLCQADAQLSEVWRRYEEITAAGQPKKTVAWMTEQYLSSTQHAAKSIHTKKQYERCAHQIINTQTKSGDLLGNIEADRITPGVIRKYMDAREAQVSANREKAFLSVCYQYCIERDLLTTNPCKEVRRNTETPDKRYVTDEEYLTVYNIAPDYIKAAMEFAYLCRMRVCEVMALRETDIKENGLHIRRRKGSRDNITTFSDRLNAAIALSRSLPYPQVRPLNPTLIRGINGTSLTEEGFSTAWQRLMVKAQEKGISRFKFHQLKAKGVSDTDGDKKAASGHKTDAMVQVYDRKLAEVKPAGKE